MIFIFVLFCFLRNLSRAAAIDFLRETAWKWPDSCSLQHSERWISVFSVFFWNQSFLTSCSRYCCWFLRFYRFHFHDLCISNFGPFYFFLLNISVICFSSSLCFCCCWWWFWNDISFFFFSFSWFLHLHFLTSFSPLLSLFFHWIIFCILFSYLVKYGFIYSNIRSMFLFFYFPFYLLFFIFDL